MSKLKFLLFLLVTVQIFSYDYYKEINLSGEEDYKELYITEDIYSKAKKDLSDIRIISEAGKEIAYAIEKEKGKNNPKKENLENKKVKLNFTQEERDKKSLITIESKNLPLERLKIVAHGEFKRDYYFDVNYHSGTIFKVGEKENLTIDFNNNIREKKLLLYIENGDSTPIKIDEIIGEYPLEKIMFKVDNGKKYQITFGDDSLSKPHYDLAEFNDLIEKRDVVTAGELNFKEKEILEEPKDYSTYYNIFIGVIAILLTIFMIKKITKK